MAEKKFSNPHWYKEKRTNAEARKIYRKARKLGMTRAYANRVRYWSDAHIEQIFKNFPLINVGKPLTHSMGK